MTAPQLSIIIPTYNRPELLPRAVASALQQTIEAIEVIVVDDGSLPAVDLPEQPRLRVIRLANNQGGAAARNIGAAAAHSQWLTYLDDDDVLLPHMAAKTLEAIQHLPANLPRPIGILFGLNVVTPEGKVVTTHLPPTLPRGAHFCLEEIPARHSFYSKQTLVVEREVLLNVGGFDPNFASRIHTELFLRLNSVCSLWGLPEVTYQLSTHAGARVSSNSSKRQRSFEQLLQKHQDLFKSHAQWVYADFVFNHADKLYQNGQHLLALKMLGQAGLIHPLHTLARLGSPYKRKFLNVFSPVYDT